MPWREAGLVQTLGSMWESMWERTGSCLWPAQFGPGLSYGHLGSEPTDENALSVCSFSMPLNQMQVLKVFLNNKSKQHFKKSNQAKHDAKFLSQNTQCSWAPTINKWYGEYQDE